MTGVCGGVAWCSVSGDGVRAGSVEPGRGLLRAMVL